MENESARFETQIVNRWYVIVNACYMLPLCIAVGVFSIFACQSVATGLTYMGIMLMACAVTLFVYARQKPTTVKMIGQKLYLKNYHGKDYEVPFLTQEEFRFHQSSYEQKDNVGRVIIRGTPYRLYGVGQFNELKAYVESTLRHQVVPAKKK